MSLGFVLAIVASGLFSSWAISAAISPFAASRSELISSSLAFSSAMSLTWTCSVDGSSNVLQAWDMLHGNLLLRNWWLSDVSFYTTELPEYMLVELVRGLLEKLVAGQHRRVTAIIEGSAGRLTNPRVREAVLQLHRQIREELAGD